MDRHVVREQKLDHDVPALSVQLLEYDDGSVEFSDVSTHCRQNSTVTSGAVIAVPENRARRY